MTLKTRFWLFVYGYPNILGSILGLASISLLFLGIIGQGWVFITAGAYALGWVAGWTVLPEHDSSIKTTMQDADLKTSLTVLASKSIAKLPKEAADILGHIRDLVRELLDYSVAELPLEQAHSIEGVVRNYLPTTLNSYFRLPPMYARMHVLKDGKTAEGLLIEQLRLLESGLKKMLDNVASNDAQALLANGRFLDSRFNTSDSFQT